LSSSVFASAAAAAAASQPLTIRDVKGAYDARSDARVATRRLTAVEAALDFARAWPAHSAGGAAVSRTDFADYYADVGALLAAEAAGVVDEAAAAAAAQDDGGSDAAFRGRLHDAWHLPGGGSWKRPASKRVLATLYKGTARVVLLPEAEAIADDDQAGLIEALRALGHGGVARVAVLETIDTV
jgi:hypothetical protein